jgi:hypothetical protein
MKSNVINYPDFDGTENCSGMGADLFYVEYGTASGQETARYIKSFCDNCKKLSQCAEYGIKHERFGFWGGLTPNAREMIRRKNGITLALPEHQDSQREPYKKTNDKHWGQA